MWILHWRLLRLLSPSSQHFGSVSMLAEQSERWQPVTAVIITTVYKTKIPCAFIVSQNGTTFSLFWPRLCFNSRHAPFSVFVWLCLFWVCFFGKFPFSGFQNSVYHHRFYGFSGILFVGNRWYVLLHILGFFALCHVYCLSEYAASLFLFFSISPNLLLWNQVVQIEWFFLLSTTLYTYYKAIRRYLAFRVWSSGMISRSGGLPVSLFTFLRALPPEVMPHCSCSIYAAFGLGLLSFLPMPAFMAVIACFSPLLPLLFFVWSFCVFVFWESSVLLAYSCFI